MTDQRRAHLPSRARVCVPLLVLTVLTGLVAMHGLGPQPTLKAHHQATAPESTSAFASEPASAERVHAAIPRQRERAAAHSSSSSCHPLAYGHEQGHLHHADTACAASGVSGGPAMAPLTPSRETDGDTGVPLAGVGPTTAAERAPPSLAQLQLLRL